MRSSIIHYSLFIILALLIFRPLLGTVWYPMHDTTHLARLYLMEGTIRGGQFPPIWATGINQGLGYPLFHFYAPLFYYLALLVKLVTGSYFTAVKVVLFSSSVLGMLGMYTLMKKWGRGVAFFSSLAFGTLPYMAVNLYVRGAYAETLALSLLPWLFYAWQNLGSHQRQIMTAIITTLFILSHNLIPLITFPFLLIWILFHHHHHLKALILPILATITLSSFYLLPLIFERNFVQADSIAKTTNYSLHYVAPSQLWNSTWGYGGSAMGLEDGMSFKLGKIVVLLSLGSLLLLRKRYIQLLVTSALLTIFMTTPYSQFIWDHLALLQVIQFPWRYLGLVGFFLSSLAGLSFTLIKNKFARNSCLLLAVCCLLLTNLKLFAPQSTFPADLSRYTSSSYLETLPQIIPEFAPRWLSNPLPASSLDRAYYPTWKVIVDGKLVPTRPSVSGLLSYPNPTQSTNIQLIQSHTNLERFSYALTILTLITLIIYAKI
ncbi:MAG: 6-pyruvoyl-tetrahydropterin synthase-related protein [bacterium]